MIAVRIMMPALLFEESILNKKGEFLEVLCCQNSFILQNSLNFQWGIVVIFWPKLQSFAISNISILRASIFSSFWPGTYLVNCIEGALGDLSFGGRSEWQWPVSWWWVYQKLFNVFVFFKGPLSQWPDQPKDRDKDIWRALRVAMANKVVVSLSEMFQFFLHHIGPISKLLDQPKGKDKIIWRALRAAMANVVVANKHIFNI